MDADETFEVVFVSDGDNDGVPTDEEQRFSPPEICKNQVASPGIPETQTGRIHYPPRTFQQFFSTDKITEVRHLFLSTLPGLYAISKGV